jgi:ABC-type transport system involved in multi-copper enzyme maturation permease subunit
MMYYWKCWRETRVSFYIFLFLGVVLAAVPWKITEYTVGDMGQARSFALGWLILLLASSGVASLAGMSFGATGIGEEFSHKTAVFLLTKPRSIGYFVWTAWTANAVQFLTLTGAMVLVGATLLSWRCHVPLTGRFLLSFLPTVIMASLLFGVTYLLGVAFKNGRNGFMGSLGFVIVLPIACSVVEYIWHVHLLSPMDMYPAELGRMIGHPEILSTLPPLWPSVGWSLVALACPFIAQIVLERTEV